MLGKQRAILACVQLDLQFLRTLSEPIQTKPLGSQKGIVFTEFLEMVEQKFGMDMVNDLIDNNSLSSGGVPPLLMHTTTAKW